MLCHITGSSMFCLEFLLRRVHDIQCPLKPLKSAYRLLPLTYQVQLKLSICPPKSDVQVHCSRHINPCLPWRKLKQAPGLPPGSLLKELDNVKCIGTRAYERPSHKKFTFAWNLLQKAASRFFHLGKSPISYSTWQARKASQHVSSTASLLMHLLYLCPRVLKGDVLQSSRCLGCRQRCCL